MANNTVEIKIDAELRAELTRLRARVAELEAPELAAYAWDAMKKENAELRAELEAVKKDRDEWERKSKNNGFAAALAIEAMDVDKKRIEKLEEQIKSMVPASALESMKREARRLQGEVIDADAELTAARKWAAAWKRAAKQHRADENELDRMTDELYNAWKATK